MSLPVRACRHAGSQTSTAMQVQERRMPHYLPSSSNTDGGEAASVASMVPTADAEMNDLKIFWGPEICRLEYLLHLLDTGRIKDEYESPHA
jgi:hypothetical protein